MKPRLGLKTGAQCLVGVFMEMEMLSWMLMNAYTSGIKKYDVKVDQGGDAALTAAM